MVEQLLEDQYDDDLTAVKDEYTSSHELEAVDLFEYVGNDESPISKLKSIVLSIDWEITDDILEQFIEELQDLKDIWAEDRVKQVYVQGLEKITKYIYKEKANANPNAIKLLLTFYRDLEKIVTTESMDYEEKKRILLEDVKRFEFLKRQILDDGQQESQETAAAVSEKTIVQAAPEPNEVSATVDLLEPSVEDEPITKSTIVLGDTTILRGLKAAILGIDWEITDQDLNLLAHEVHTLERTFQDSKAKRIFLQGIGALGAYINLKRSNAHAGAFTLLRSFFDGMEKIVEDGLFGEDEKKILLAEADKFNDFKKVIAATIPRSADRIRAEQDAVQGGGETGIDDDITEPVPALSDVSDDFQKKPSIADGSGETDEMVSDAHKFFDEEETGEVGSITATTDEQKDSGDDQVISEIDTRLQDFFGADSDEEPGAPVDSETALQGVDVESSADDDSDEEPLPIDEDDLAPALSSVDEGQSAGEGIEKMLSPEETQESVNEFTQVMLVDGEESEDETIEQVLQGVDVETEADDDSGEEPLPMVDGEIAPALAGHEGESGFSEDFIVGDQGDHSTNKDIQNRLDEFFLDDIDESSSGARAYAETLQEVNNIDDEIEPPEKSKERLDSFFASDDHEEPDQIVVEDEVAPVSEDIEELYIEDDVSLIPDEREELADALHMEDAELISGDLDVGELFEDADVLEGLGEELVDDVFEVEGDEGRISDDFEDLGRDLSGEIDEVIFELVDDEPDSDQEVVFYAVGDEDDKIVLDSDDFDMAGFRETVGGQDDDFLSFDDIEEDEPAGDLDDIEIAVPGQEDAAPMFSGDQLDDGENIEFDLFGDEEDVGSDGYPAAVVIPAEEKSEFTGDLPSLEILQDCIVSIGVEATDDVLKDLVREVSRLNLEMRENPIEKTFLQLISTIVQQMKQSRYGKRSGAYTLLQSIFDKLDYIGHSSLKTAQVQEILLTETSKVLLWQQTMLDVHTYDEMENQVLSDFESVEDAGQDIDESYFVEDDLDAESDEEDEILFGDEEGDEGDEILVGDEESEVSSKVPQELNDLKDNLQSDLEGLLDDLKKS